MPVPAESSYACAEEQGLLPVCYRAARHRATQGDKARAETRTGRHSTNGTIQGTSQLGWEGTRMRVEIFPEPARVVEDSRTKGFRRWH